MEEKRSSEAARIGRKGSETLVRKFRVKIEDEVYEVEVEEITSITKKQLKEEEKIEKNNILSSSPAPVSTPNSQLPNNTEGVSSSVEAKITAPLPGTVVDIKVEAGEEVQKGEVVVVIETMKMENEITSPFSGIVREVLVKAGETVASGQPLIVLY